MLGTLRHWQARIWIGDEVDQPVTVYGKSLTELRTAAADWLRANAPLAFGNAPPHYDLSRRFNYSYSDGAKMPVFPLHNFGQPLEEGWHCVQGRSPYSDPERLTDFQAVMEHFTNHALIPEKGPDYRDVPLTPASFPVYLVRTVKRETDELAVNDLLQRGWYIIALETKTTVDYRDRPLDSQTVFLLGHPEEGAV